MTKLQKVNELTGTLEDVYPNLIIVGGKNIAVPVDKQHIFKNTDAKVGDIIHIKYDERGYLLEAGLVSRGTGEAPKPKEPEKKPLAEVMKEKFAEKPEPVKEYVSLRDRIFLHQTTYKECCATVRELIMLPNESLDEEEFNRVMDIALERAKKDAKALVEAAGEPKWQPII